jgi:hypothetical protein
MDLLSSKQHKLYLLVTSKGVRTNLASIAESAERLNELASKMKTPFLLLDYQKVKFNVPHTHANDLMRLHESKMENLKNVTIAVVINPKERKLAELWKEISEKKGLWFTLFDNFDEAKEWLTTQAELHKK